MYLLMAALNFAFSFWKIVTLGGTLLKIFMRAQTVLESFPQYASSNLCCYQFANQEISYSLSLLYTSIYNQYVINSLL